MEASDELVRWTFGPGSVGAYRLRLADDGAPVEEISFRFASRLTRQVNRSVQGTTSGSGTQLGFTSGQPNGTHYGITSSDLDFPDAVAAGDLSFEWINYDIGEWRLAPEPLMVRQPPLARNSLHEWYTQVLNHEAGVRDITVYLKAPGGAPRNVLILDNAKPGDLYILKIADDGLPIEEFQLDFTGVLVP